MPEDVKDQEMLKLKELISVNAFEKAETMVNSLDIHENVKNFNLSYISFERGDMLSARVYLERAKYNGMLSSEVDTALIQVKDKLNLTMIEKEQTVIDDIVLNSVSLPREFFPTIFMFFIILSIFLGLRKMKITASATAFISLATISFFLLISKYNAEFNAEETTVHRGPSKIFEEVQVLPVGAKFIISKQVDEWKYIKYPSIYEGWIHKNKAMKL
jgi:hypothetical protein